MYRHLPCRSSRTCVAVWLVLTALFAQCTNAEIIGEYTNDNWFFDQVVSGSYTTVGPPPMMINFGPVELSPGEMLLLGDIDPTKPIKATIKEPGFDLFINIITIAASAILQHNGVNVFGSRDFLNAGTVFQFVNPSLDVGDDTLLANAEFVFNGFDPGTDNPDLRLASDTDLRMTDSFGSLLPEYQYTDPVVVAGVFTVPAPSGLMALATGFLILNRRSRNEALYM